MFWGFALLMILVALLMLLLPLWLRRKGQITLDSNAANVAVLKEQLAELESEYASGGMSKDLYEAAQADLENSVAADLVESSEHHDQALSKGARRVTGLLFAIALPVSSILLYQQLTTFRELPPQLEPTTVSENAEAIEQQHSIEDMLQALVARLNENPDDAEGWRMLGKSYAVMQRYAEAANAYTQAYNLVGDTNPELLIDYAEALAVANGNRVQGRPQQLLNTVLKLQPNNMKAHWLSGYANFQNNDFLAAIASWEKVMADPSLPAEDQQRLMQNINEARKMAGSSAAAPQQGADMASPVSVQVNVSLDEKVFDKVSASDTVFVFARLASGMPMPLAVARLKVSDLPASVKLDDSMAMLAGHSLADKEQVVIGARVSKAGSPMPASGDLEGLTDTINPKSTNEVSVLISRLIE